MKRILWLLIGIVLAAAILCGMSFASVGCDEGTDNAPAIVGNQYLPELEAACEHLTSEPYVTVSLWADIQINDKTQKQDILSATYDNLQNQHTRMFINAPTLGKEIYYVDQTFYVRSTEKYVPLPITDALQEVIDTLNADLMADFDLAAPTHYAIVKTEGKLTQYTLTIFDYMEQLDVWFGAAMEEFNQLLALGDIAFANELTITFTVKNDKLSRMVTSVAMTVQGISCNMSLTLSASYPSTVYLPSALLRQVKGDTPDNDPSDSTPLVTSEGVPTSQSVLSGTRHAMSGSFGICDVADMIEYYPRDGQFVLADDKIIYSANGTINIYDVTTKQLIAFMTCSQKSIKVSSLGSGLIGLGYTTSFANKRYEIYSLENRQCMLTTYGVPLAASDSYVFIAFRNKDDSYTVWAYKRATLDYSKLCVTKTLPTATIDDSNGVLLISWRQEDGVAYQGYKLKNLGVKWQGVSDQLEDYYGWTVSDGYFNAWRGWRISATDGAVSHHTPNTLSPSVPGGVYSRTLTQLGDYMMVEMAPNDETTLISSYFLYHEGDDYWLACIPYISKIIIIDERTVLAVGTGLYEITLTNAD